MFPKNNDTAMLRHLLAQYEQTLTRILHIGRETKGQLSGTARLMASLAAKALASRDMHGLPENVAGSASVAAKEAKSG